nr:MAG TPA: hypothetical protein [Caudoviricetes sp.]
MTIICNLLLSIFFYTITLYKRDVIFRIFSIMAIYFILKDLQVLILNFDERICV